ncbi:hypothetical protein D9758_007089 [Tetrapyrgos nigripes]|uniref:Major facilitator superfamily (MFS) profile domain-containing protein n=1 Tax=Tetrapyrgos nigripes TaxID=182062 RepID=A0A8H5LMM5_9AGAR|nr:hypothetical protein D9758_007089 [Tetrapyrgos nigripes]
MANTVNGTTEVSGTTSAMQKPPVEDAIVEQIDIEHMEVENDPREWSKFRKVRISGFFTLDYASDNWQNIVLLQVGTGAMIAGLASNIQLPAVSEMEAVLPATPTQISLTLSLFMLFQGVIPLLWSAVSEVKGRKLVYVSSLTIFTIGSIVVGTSNSIGLVIGFRIIQAAGSSAVMSVGAATLADIFDPEERGSKMGLFYIAPLLGPSLGAIFGGVFTTAFSWRGPFYFLTITGGIVTLSFLIGFRDTWRKERSAVYQQVVRRKLKERMRMKKAGNSKTGKNNHDTDVEKNVDSGSVSATVIGTSTPTEPETKFESSSNQTVDQPNMDRELAEATKDIKLSLLDVNLAKPMWNVFTRPWNLCMLNASALIFAFAYIVVYSTTRVLENAPQYHYNPLRVGLVLLSFGLGSVTGSVISGRYSDYTLKRLKKKNGGKREAEMRLQPLLIPFILFPLFIIGCGWVEKERLHIAAIVVFLFICGFFSIFIYTPTLAYIVDSNPGSSSFATALNSLLRGIYAFISLEITVPLQEGIGEGWMYVIIAAAIVVSAGLVGWVEMKGMGWRERSELKKGL